MPLAVSASSRLGRALSPLKIGGGVLLVLSAQAGLIFSVFPRSQKPASHRFVEIKRISYDDREIQKLRSELTQNMASFSKGQKIHIRWRRYRIKKNDRFFQIMAKTMQNQDTLSSINRLSSVWDVETGDLWWIPNMRGIAAYGSKKKLAKKYKVKADSIVNVPLVKNFYFVLGKFFKPEERSYFGLTVFQRPVSGVISSKYGMRKDPFTQKSRFHRGIDIACRMNSQVFSAASGRIIFTGNLSGYGRTVIIEHQNGYQSLYGHLNKILVRKGAYVKKKSLIALSGNSGRSTGPHLHFEIRRKGRARKPRMVH